MKNKLICFGIMTMFLFTAISFVSADDNTESMSFRDVYCLAKEEIFINGGEGITGISWTDEEPLKIIVYLKSEEYLNKVPKTIEGYETKTIVTGEIKALGLVKMEKQNNPLKLINSRWQHREPICGGLAIGTNQYLNFYGTLSVITEPDSQVINPENYILSCAHVIAQEKNGKHVTRPYSKVKIYQPAILQGGLNKIGYLKDYVEVRYNIKSIINPNKIDAAIAKLYDSQDADFNSVLSSDDKTTYKVRYSCVVPAKGSIVRKSGATTGVKSNDVLDQHACINVSYYQFGIIPVRWAHFEDVILVDQPFLEAGDSGSFVDYPGDDNSFVGIAFAGSPEVGVVCKSSYIISELGLNKKARSKTFEINSIFGNLIEQFPLLQQLLKIK